MILVYIEDSKGEIPKTSLSLISAAKAAKAAHGHEKIVGLVLGGAGTESAANAASKYGLDEILFVESENLSNYVAISYANIIQEIAKEKGASLIMMTASMLGKDLAPRVAQGLDAGQASDVLAFLDKGLFRRPMFAGNIIADVRVTTETKVATIRPTAFDAAEEGSSSPVQKVDLEVASTPLMSFVGFDETESERPELSDAEVVISGGRALKSEENFKEYLEPLADVLNAAIGASRAAVDAGYAPNDWQVGQTGKVVAPKLYIAIGISGAIQHLAGMKDSKTIVAINKDPDAPIFEIADYGLVADLYDVVPKLVEELKKVG